MPVRKRVVAFDAEVAFAGAEREELRVQTRKIVAPGKFRTMKAE